MNFPGGGSSWPDDMPKTEEDIIYADLGFDTILRPKAFWTLMGIIADQKYCGQELIIVRRGM